MPKEITDTQRLDWLIKELSIDEIGNSGDSLEAACGMACAEAGPHDVTDELLDRMYLKAFKSAIDAQITWIATLASTPPVSTSKRRTMASKNQVVPVTPGPFDPTGFADMILGGLRTAPSSESPAGPPRHWTDLVEEVVRYGFHYVDLRFTHNEISSCRFKGPDGIMRHEYHSTLSMQESVERCYAAWKAEK